MYSKIQMATFTRFRAAALSLRASQINACSARALSTTPAHSAYSALRNERIGRPVVQLVDPETGKLREPERLTDVVARIDKEHYYVELVNEEPPIVKIISKKDDYLKKKAAKLKAKEAKGRQMETKELQMTWGVAVGDIEHKMKKARQELERGNRVELVYAKKKRQPVPSPADQEAVVNAAVQKVEDIAMEWKARYVQKTMTVVYLQPQQSS
jgi:translation initiation factor IF-3